MTQAPPQAHPTAPTVDTDDDHAQRSDRSRPDDARRSGLEAAQELFEQLPDPLHTQDAAGRITACNRAWLQTFGYERADVVGREIGSFLPEADRTTTLLDQLVDGAGTQDLVLQIECSDGTAKGMMLTSRQVPDPATGRRTTLMRLRDVSSMKQLQAVAAQQEKLASVGMLAAGVAHEINNPIGFIASMLGSLDKYTKRVVGMLEAMKELEAAVEAGDLDAARGAKARLAQKRKADKVDFCADSIPSLISRCQEGAERVKKIVNDLRSFARNDDNTMGPTDLNQVLESSLNIAWNELKYKATIVKELGEIPSIEANASKLSQVFINMLVNAAHALPAQGTVTVRSSVKDGVVTASISDTGSGIKPENLSKLFDPFFTTKPVGQGTGIGLNIAYNIVKQHGGDVRVESTVGEGTTFYVDFPIERQVK